MNEQYVKSFVDKFKAAYAELLAVRLELETLIEFKDAEIAGLRAQIEELSKPKEEAETV